MSVGSVVDAIRTAYVKLESKYYELLEYLQERHIPLASAAYFFESRGIPSLPVFAVLLVGIIALIYVVTHPVYIITVYGVDGQPLPHQKVYIDGEVYFTGPDGTVHLSHLPSSVQVPVPGASTVFDNISRAIYLKPIIKHVEIVVSGGNGPVTATIQVTGASTKVFTGSDVDFNVSLVPADGAIQASGDGSIEVVVSASGYELANETLNWNSLQDNQVVHINLVKKQPPKATVSIRTNPPINGYAYLYQNGEYVGLQGTITEGIGTISGVPYGSYVLVISVLRDGHEYFDPEGRNKQQILVNSATVPVSVNVYVPPRILKSTVEVVDYNSGAPIENAVLREGNETVATTNYDGNAVISLQEGKCVEVTVDANDYVSASAKVCAGKSVTVRLKRVIHKGTLRISVVDGTGAPISGAKIVLTSGNTRVRAVTGDDGVATVSVPVGTWDISAYFDGYHATQKGVRVVENKVESVTITLAPTVSVPVSVYVVRYGREVGTVAKVFAISTGGKVLWSGSTSLQGSTTVSLPQYSTVYFKVDVSVSGREITYYTAPYLIVPGVSVKVVFGNNLSVRLEGIMNSNGSRFLSIDGNGLYTLLVQVPCAGSGCQYPISADGMKVVGIAAPSIPARLSTPPGGKGAAGEEVLSLTCRDCVVVVPLLVKRDGNTDCAKISVGKDALAVGAAVAVPDCGGSYCVKSVAPPVVRTGQFFSLSVAGVGNIYSLNLAKNKDVYVSKELADKCSTAFGTYILDRATVGFLNRTQLSAEVQTKQGVSRTVIPISVLEGNVAAVHVSIYPPVIFPGCGDTLSVSADKNSVPKGESVVLSVQFGRTVVSKKVAPGKVVQFRLPKNELNALKSVVVTAEAPLAFPAKVKVPVYPYAFDILDSASLSTDSNSGKRCAVVHIRFPDSNALSAIGSITSPKIVVDRVVSGGQSGGAVSKMLSITEKIIGPFTQHLTICLSGKIPSLKESERLKVLYHISGKPSAAKCKSISSSQGTLTISLKGMGKCLSGYWTVPKGPIFAIGGGSLGAGTGAAAPVGGSSGQGYFPSSSGGGSIPSTMGGSGSVAEFVLKNMCKHTTVSGSVAIVASNPAIYAVATPTSFDLGPGSSKTFKVMVSSRGSGIVKGYITVTVDYRADNHSHTYSLPPKLVVAGSVAGCVSLASSVITYDSQEGIVVSLRNKCSPVLRLSDVNVLVGTSAYRLDCIGGSVVNCSNCIGGSVVSCSTRNIPAQTILPVLLSGSKVHLSVSGTVASLKKRFTLFDKDVDVRKISVRSVIRFISYCNTVKDETPFPGDLNVCYSGDTDCIRVTPSNPTDAGSVLGVDLCQGKVSSANASLVFSNGTTFSLKDLCSKSVEPPFELKDVAVISGPPVELKENGKVSVAYPQKNMGCYAYSISAIKGSVKVQFSGTDVDSCYPCSRGVCDSNRAALDAVRWIYDTLHSPTQTQGQTQKQIEERNFFVVPFDTSVPFIGYAYKESDAIDYNVGKLSCSGSTLQFNGKPSNLTINCGSGTVTCDNSSELNCNSSEKYRVSCPDHNVPVAVCKNKGCSLACAPPSADVFNRAGIVGVSIEGRGKTESKKYVPPVLTFKLYRDANVARFASMLNKDLNLFHAFLEALVMASNEEPMGFAEKYPFVGWFGCNPSSPTSVSCSSYTGYYFTRIPLFGSGSSAFVYVEGVGRVPSSHVYDTDCGEEQKLVLWTYGVSSGSAVPYLCTDDANLLVVPDPYARTIHFWLGRRCDLENTFPGASSSSSAQGASGTSSSGTGS